MKPRLAGEVKLAVRFRLHLHSIACRWLEKEGSLAALQQVLGHATLVTTQRYARRIDAALRPEAERLAAL